MGKWKTEKMLPDRMSLTFCCNIQMVVSEFGMKAASLVSMAGWIQWPYITLPYLF